jgi:hypothetical protein
MNKVIYALGAACALAILVAVWSFGFHAGEREREIDRISERLSAEIAARREYDSAVDARVKRLEDRWRGKYGDDPK